jgi:asparagine N-glycosylation enzyme membrane subunit Stt3
MLMATVIIYLAALIGIALMYAYFTELDSCSLNKFFITSTLFLSVVVSVIAILPWIQRVQPKSGLLQAAVVSGYCTYQTWSAISTEPYGPDRNCNIGDSTFAVFSDSGNALAASIVGILVLLITVAYVCFTLSSTAQLRKFRGGSKDEDESSLLGNENVYIRKLCIY